MVVEAPKPPTLRRSCQACARGKRRCDQRWPRCGRCQTRRIECEYINVPLPVSTSIGPNTMTTTTPTPANTSRPRKPGRSNTITTRTATLSLPSHLPPLEITKGYSPTVISFLCAGMRQYPLTFASSLKTHFIHPDLWPSPTTPPAPLRDILTLCKHYTSPLSSASHRDPHSLHLLLHQKSRILHRHITRASTFPDLLASAQALLLLQCILLLAPDHADQQTQAYQESISDMLMSLGHRLWTQAPVQLPRTLSPRQAWLFAESVRRTIIVGFMLRSVYSLHTRNYSARTPFVDALPFDVRTGLWDAEGGEGPEALGAEREGVWESSEGALVSLHGYSGMLEQGQVHSMGAFAGLILAACRGKQIADV
ncbi:Zn(II)2Cys6 transcription factor domain-containing protein, partial [Aspergillus saccharolyticus JOP 1030-1]